MFVTKSSDRIVISLRETREKVTFFFFFCKWHRQFFLNKRGKGASFVCLEVRKIDFLFRRRDRQHYAAPHNDQLRKNHRHIYYTTILALEQLLINLIRKVDLNIVTAFKAILRNHDKCGVANAWFDCMSFQMRSLPSAFQIVQMLEILRANIIICSKTWTIIRETEEMETIIVSPAMTD